MATESNRRFTKNLLKPGSAAEIRQTACNAVRHCAVTVSNRPAWIVKTWWYSETVSPPVGPKLLLFLFFSCFALGFYCFVTLYSSYYYLPKKPQIQLSCAPPPPAPVKKTQHLCIVALSSRPGIDIQVASFLAVE